MKPIVYCILAVVAFVVVLRDPSTTVEQEAALRKRRILLQDRPVQPYMHWEIEQVAPYLHSFAPRLLVFDGNVFSVYNLKSNATTYHDVHDFGNRPVMIVPLLVHALKTKFPNRFEQGQAPFQLLFTDADSLRTDCVNPGVECYTNKWPPILVFGSLMKDAAQTFPSAQVMPVPPFCECLYKYLIRGEQDCDWGNTPVGMVSKPVPQLKPNIIWRGSDYAFLFQYEKFRFKDSWDVLGKDVSNLTREDVAVKVFQNWNDIGPRWRGVALSLQAEIERPKDNVVWLDSKFAGDMPGMSEKTLQHFQEIGVHVKAESMDPVEMATHRYQIDYGGGGGTTWSGTLSKLAMPGVLFHHETPTMDWFHYDMEPWKHYIPINWDLTDLRAKYDWSQANLDKVQRISKEASKLSNYLLSKRFMKKTFQDLFVSYLGKVVKAYKQQPGMETWDDCKQQYERMGFRLQPLATCNHVHCTVRTQREKTETSSRILRYVPKKEQ